MKNILPALTQEEFKNILHLIASRDSECRILGQTFAKHYGFSHKTYVNNIVLDREYVVTEKHLYPINGLIEINGWINYEEGYKRYLASYHTRGIYQHN